jgi:hypothetical protein
MTTANAALLDALADCLESGESLVGALEKVATVGGAAGPWAQWVRRHVQADLPVAAGLRASGVLDESELELLAADGASDTAGALLHAVVLRRRRRSARRRAILWGLVGPVGIGALTVVLDPLPNLVSGGAYLWPACRGLLIVTVMTLAVVAGIPAIFGHPRLRLRALRLCMAMPGIRWFAEQHAEEELTAALTPFIDGGEVRGAGLAAAASLLPWSPLCDDLRAAGCAAQRPPAPAAMGGLEPLARHLSVGTKLAIVGGVASRRLAERLVQRREAVTASLTVRVRLVARIGAYALVVFFSITSVANMVSHGLPAMPTIPGVTESAEQKQLDELLKQLEP